MTQFFRNPSGGLVDRARQLSFTFDGDSYQGYDGDTLASALLASGVRLIGRSFKYHRPRGIFSIGPEEPGALVHLGSATGGEPNTKATQVQLCDGLIATSQNRWPTTEIDLLSVNDHLNSLLAAGFYYKTFMAPRRFWPYYEKLIRHAAGMGRGPVDPDTSNYDQRFAHCDVLIVGAGSAGLAAALAAANSNAKVLLVDDAPAPGGWLRRERLIIDGLPGHQWAEQTVSELAERENVTVLSSTTAFGYYDHNLVALIEQSAGETAERLWRVRARQVVLATGAIERPIAFPNNDRPGVMLAAAARGYVNQFAVRPGKRAVIFTNNDSAYRTAIDLQDAGVEVHAVVDVRAEPGTELTSAMKGRDIDLLSGSIIRRALGRRTLHGAEIALYSPGFIGKRRKIRCDLLCVSGGWSPTVHLHAQSGGRPLYDDTLHCFLPGNSKQAERSAGAAAGRFRLKECLLDGLNAGLEAARACGLKTDNKLAVPESSLVELSAATVEPHWAVPPDTGRAKCFIDIQNDVTLRDVALAHREGYDSIEHLKRYTTLGMGTDQGKTSNVIAMGVLAEYLEKPVASMGTTTFRPPYTPVSLGALAGRRIGKHIEPVRRSPMYAQHEALQARFAPNGHWERPQYYRAHGDSSHVAAEIEANAVRRSVGITDISTLGKFELQGADALDFLNRIYINDFNQLAVDRSRYAMMLREDGMIFDDGTVTRLGENHFFITTTTGNAETVRQHFEYWLDVVWPDLDANLIPVTDQWAAVAIAGPNSRALLQKITKEADLSSDISPHMSFADGIVAGAPAGIVRVSFSGELAYEVYVPARSGARLWDELTQAGEEFDVVPYGMDALEILRIEKGYIGVGAEVDGRVTPYDVGYGSMISLAKDFVGKWGLGRPALHEPGRPQLVGLEPLNGKSPLGIGGQILNSSARTGIAEGFVSSAAFSPVLGKPIALAMLNGGRNRLSDVVYVVDPLRGRKPVAVRVTRPCFFDPDGERLKM